MKILHMKEILSKYDLFNQLSPYTLELLSGCSSNAHFKPGRLIFREGESADHFYLIRKGHVSLEISVPGRGPVFLETLGDGDLLGWSCLLPPYRWHADVRVHEELEGIAIDIKCLRGKFEQNQELEYQLLKIFVPVIVKRLQATRLRLLDMYGVPEEAKKK